jgi:hypothetical protein
VSEFGLIIPAPAEWPRAALAATPRLRALLQRSRPLPVVAQGLHAALHAASGVSAPLSALPVGPVSALGDGLAVTTQCALAEPLALEVHTDHVTLAGLPQPAVTASEADALVAALNALLGEDGLRCERVTAERWYLHGEGMAALAGGLASVAELSGTRLDEATQPAAEARRLRRLLTEAQMLFHQHPVNSLREEQGLARIDGLWLSGAGALPARLQAGALLLAQAPFGRGLMQLAGIPALEVPLQFDAALSASHAAAAGSTMPWVHAAPAGANGHAEALALLERDWLAPAWRALACGEIDALCWRDDQGRGGRMSRRDRLRAWARRLP